MLAKNMSDVALPLEEIARLLPGLALSDVERRLASPLDTIRRVKFSQDAAQLIQRANDFEAQALIFGLPLNMDGTAGPRAQATQAFMRNLRKLTPLPFAFWDERLSTAAVTRDLIANDVSRAKRARRDRPHGRRWGGARRLDAGGGGAQAHAARVPEEAAHVVGEGEREKGRSGRGLFFVRRGGVLARRRHAKLKAMLPLRWLFL